MNIHWKIFSTFSLVCNKTTGFPIGWLEGMRSSSVWPAVADGIGSDSVSQLPASEWEERVWTEIKKTMAMQS